MALVCDVCGRPSPHFFLRQVKDESYAWGVRDVWSCHRCIDQRLQVRELLEGEGCLNTTELCRLFNGYGKRDVRHCSSTFKDKPFRGSVPYHLKPCNLCACTINHVKVRRILFQLLTRGQLETEKRLWWDHTRAKGICTDVFRFWFISRAAYRDRVLAQTLEGYQGDRAS